MQYARNTAAPLAHLAYRLYLHIAGTDSSGFIHMLQQHSQNSSKTFGKNADCHAEEGSSPARATAGMGLKAGAGDDLATTVAPDAGLTLGGWINVNSSL